MQVFQTQVKSSMHLRKDGVRNFMTCPLTICTMFCENYIDSRACLVHTLCVFALCFCYAKTLTRRAKTLGLVHQSVFLHIQQTSPLQNQKNTDTYHIHHLLLSYLSHEENPLSLPKWYSLFLIGILVSLLYCLMKKTLNKWWPVTSSPKNALKIQPFRVPNGVFFGLGQTAPTSEFKSSAPEMVSQGKARSTWKGRLSWRRMRSQELGVSK